MFLVSNKLSAYVRSHLIISVLHKEISILLHKENQSEMSLLIDLIISLILFILHSLSTSEYILVSEIIFGPMRRKHFSNIKQIYSSKSEL